MAWSGLVEEARKNASHLERSTELTDRKREANTCIEASFSTSRAGLEAFEVICPGGAPFRGPAGRSYYHSRICVCMASSSQHPKRGRCTRPGPQPPAPAPAPAHPCPSPETQALGPARPRKSGSPGGFGGANLSSTHARVACLSAGTATPATPTTPSQVRLIRQSGWAPPPSKRGCSRLRCCSRSSRSSCLPACNGVRSGLAAALTSRFSRCARRSPHRQSAWPAGLSDLLIHILRRPRWSLWSRGTIFWALTMYKPYLRCVEEHMCACEDTSRCR